MKLFVGALALSNVNADLCASGDLFTVTCSASTGFSITVADTCLTASYPHINTANAFFFGDNSVRTMLNPAGTTGADIVAGTTCSDFKIDTAAWTVGPIGLNTCGITEDGTDQNNYVYNLYFNPVQTAGNNNMNSVLLMSNQVKITCKIPKNVQVDSGAVSIEYLEQTTDKESTVDLRSELKLEHHTGYTDDGTAKAYVNTVIGSTDSSSTNPPLGSLASLTIANSDGSKTLKVFDTYSVNLYKCWAETAGSRDADGNFVDSNGNTLAVGQSTYDNAQTNSVLLWDEFCPLFKWVGPMRGSAPQGTFSDFYDMAAVTTANAQDWRTIHFSTFAIIDGTEPMAASATQTMYFHCQAKICPVADKGNCVLQKLDGSPLDTCNAPTARRRRSADQNDTEEIDFVVPVEVEVVTAEECAEVDPTNNKVCRSKRAANSSATCMAASATMAAAAIFNL